MTGTLKVGDRMTWNSEVGYASGQIVHDFHAQVVSVPPAAVLAGADAFPSGCTRLLDGCAMAIMSGPTISSPRKRACSYSRVVP